MTLSTEADTCRKYVLPKLIDAGWDNEPHSFTEQRTTPKPSPSSSRNSNPVSTGGRSGKRPIRPGKSPPPNCWPTIATLIEKTRTPRRISPTFLPSKLPIVFCKRNGGSRRLWRISKLFCRGIHERGRGRCSKSAVSGVAKAEASFLD